MKTLERFSYTSRLRRVHPLGKTVFALAGMVMALASSWELVSALILLLMSALILHYGSIRGREYLRLLSIPAGFLLLGTATIILHRYGTASSTIYAVRIGNYCYGTDQAALRQGGRLFLRALAAVSSMYFLSLNTTMTDLFQLFDDSPMPELLVTLMKLIYQYIFVIWEEASRMRTAEKCRLGDIHFKRSVQSMGTLIASLFFRAYQRCDRSYGALESRGYEGHMMGLREEYLSARGWYLGAILVVVMALGLMWMEGFL